MSEKTFKLDKKAVVYIGIALVGVIILIFSGINMSDKGNGDKASSENVLDPEAYAGRVEAEVIALCESVVGRGRVDAVVSLAGGYRSVYASDSQSSSSGYKSSTVLVGSGSSEEAVLVCYENPEISGIGIVLSCNESEAVRNSIISLVCAAFDVRSNKIYVAFG